MSESQPNILAQKCEWKQLWTSVSGSRHFEGQTEAKSATFVNIGPHFVCLFFVFCWTDGSLSFVQRTSRHLLTFPLCTRFPYIAPFMRVQTGMTFFGTIGRPWICQNAVKLADCSLLQLSLFGNLSRLSCFVIHWVKMEYLDKCEKRKWLVNEWQKKARSGCLQHVSSHVWTLPSPDLPWWLLTLQKRFLFNHTNPFSTKGLEKSLCDFTGIIFVLQCENPVVSTFAWWHEVQLVVTPHVPVEKSELGVVKNPL